MIRRWHRHQTASAHMAVKEGFFADAEAAAPGVHPMLVSMLRSDLIRETSDGIFMPPTLSQMIKLRRVR